MKVRPALVLIQNNCVLTMRYRYGQTDVYNLPGGNPDTGETMPQTIIRELFEEMGIEVTVAELLACGEVILPQQAKDVLHCVFLGEIKSGIPILNSQETSAEAIVWQPIGQLDTLNMYPNIGKDLKNILQQQTSGVYLGKIDQAWYA